MEQDLNPCNPPAYIKDVNIDPPPPYCREGDEQTSQKDVPGRDFSWLLEATQQKTGIGQNAACDPMLKGYVRNDQGPMGGNVPSDVVYRYSKALRGCNEAVRDMFRDIVVDDEYGVAHPVPIIWGTQEKAVAMLIQENFRKDNSLVVDRLKLPAMAIHDSSIAFAPKRYIYHKATDYLLDPRRGNKPGFTVRERFNERDTIFGVTRGIPLDISYTLYVWTLYREDLDEIAEQIIQKIVPTGYIRVQGVGHEIPVRSDSMGSHIEVNPGEGKVNVFKYEFNMTAETYMPQPLVRKKAVLKTRTEFVDNVDDEKVTDILFRLEEAVKELE
jgi:hypothetical protein